MSDSLQNAYPKLAATLRKRSFASLPTPISHHTIELASGDCTLAVKHDDRTSPIYGGNKVRKLEYFFQRARDRGATRIATFGTVGSNHALATAIFARKFGFACTCFLAHQKPSSKISGMLDAHLNLGTELVRDGSGIDRRELFRRYLQNRNVWVIPLGGTCWLGTVGFVNAGLELAAQIERGELETPDRIYIANGTMGTVAGLALGLALAELPSEIHAVRVTDKRYANQDGLYKLMRKTTMLLNRIDPSIPADLPARSKVVWRDEFFAGGYTLADDATQRAVDFAKDTLGLTLETTYTGKAMAALRHDLKSACRSHTALFWNTYNSRPLPAIAQGTPSRRELPEVFERYYDTGENAIRDRSD